MIANCFSPVKSSTIRCSFIVVLLLLVYLLDSPMIASFFGGQIFNYLFKPLIWIGIACMIRLLPQARCKGKLRLQGSLCGWSFIFAFISIVVFVISGLFDGLGRSPYSHSPVGIALNMIAVISALVGREMVRNFLVNTLTTEENYLIFTLVALILTFIGFPLNRYADLKGFKAGIQFVGQDFAPELSKNIFASYLAFLGGPITSMIYMGVLDAFNWLSPILPNLKWITSALVGVLTPVFSLMAMQYIYASESRTLKNRNRKQESPTSWMVTCLLSIGIIWFAVGVFPIYPSVIATGSMSPIIKPGDVILVRKVTKPDSLKVGDIIQYRKDDVLISHRITEIIKEEGSNKYRTKGDSNSHADFDLVHPKQVKGKIIRVVPKIGWPTLLMKRDDSIPLDRFEF